MAMCLMLEGRMWRPEVGGRYLLQTLPSLVFETGSLIELGAMLADQKLQDPYVSASPTPG